MLHVCYPLSDITSPALVVMLVIRNNSHSLNLTLIWVGCLGVSFGVGGIIPLVENLSGLCQKLEIWYGSTHTYLVSANLLFSTRTPLILLMSAVFPKKSAIFDKNVTFIESNSTKAVLESF